MNISKALQLKNLQTGWIIRGRETHSAVRRPKSRNEGVSDASQHRSIGSTVRHPQFGPGEVLANLPDGTVLVRFDRSTKNRPVWPGFLHPVPDRAR